MDEELEAAEFVKKDIRGMREAVEKENKKVLDVIAELGLFDL